MAATLEGKRLAVGEGSSRQRAEEIAASGAMELLAAELTIDVDRSREAVATDDRPTRRP